MNARKFIYLSLTCVSGLACLGLTFGNVTHSVWTRVFPSNLEISPRRIDLGTKRAGELHLVTVWVHNRSPHQVQFLGARSGCGCLLPMGIPKVIPPGERRELQSTVKIPDHEAPEAVSYRFVISFLTDRYGWLDPIRVELKSDSSSNATCDEQPLEPIPYEESEGVTTNP